MEDYGDNLPDGVLRSTRIKAGKRTYFIDVKQTRQEDYFIAITESKKKFTPGDKPEFVRHKVLVYKEDFNKILNGLVETIDYVKTELMPDFDFEKFDRDTAEIASASSDDQFSSSAS